MVNLMTFFIYAVLYILTEMKKPDFFLLPLSEKGEIRFIDILKNMIYAFFVIYFSAVRSSAVNTAPPAAPRSVL